MTQPNKAYYLSKQFDLNELKFDLNMIILKAEKMRCIENLLTTNPDTAAYTKLIERLKKAKMALDFPLANVERMMNN